MMTSPGTVVGPTTGQIARRLRAPALVLLLVVIGAIALGLAQSRAVRGELDPRAVDPAGSRALATLLRDRDVAVDRTTSAGDALDRATPRSTVLVAFPELIRTDDLRRLAEDLPSGARLVLIGAGGSELDLVTDEVRSAGSVDESVRDPECAAEPARIAGDADLGGRAYFPDDADQGCYPVGGDPTLVFGTTRSGNDLVLLGTGDPLTNERIDERGNAALSLLLLGADGTSDRVVWLMSVPGSAADDDSVSLVDVLPDWWPVAAIQLLLAAAVVALWRARRLGPPVVEPLPVVVRAAETVEGRARLYRRAAARDRAAEALRAGALARIVAPIRLGTDPPPGDVVRAVAFRTKRPEQYVSWLLFGPPPADDAELVRLAGELDILVSVTLASTPD